MMSNRALAPKMLALLTLSPLALLAPGQARAADGCQLTSLIVSGISASYDPFDPSPAISPVQISARTSGGDCGGARLQMVLVNSQTSPETGASARLVQGSSAILTNVTIAGQAAPVVQETQAFTANPASLPVGNAGSLAGNATLGMSVREGQVARPGFYSASLQIAAQLVDRNGHVDSQMTVPVLLSLSVIPSMRLVGGNMRLIDLGELTDNKESAQFAFTAYANDDYALVVSSQNGFQIKRRSSPNTPGVRYSPVLANASLSSADSSGAMRAQFAPPLGGIQHHQVSIRVGAVDGLAAGDYSDVMTLQIQPKI